MKKIITDKIEDGMILAKPLMGSSGNVLLSDGVILKKAMITRLKNWDVPFVVIQSEGELVEEAAATSTVEFRTTELDEIFKDVLKNPIMKIVYESARDYLHGKMDGNNPNKGSVGAPPPPQR